MQRMARLAIPILLLMSACGGGARVGETTGRESAAGDVDVADRECRVILRRADFIADRTTGLAVTIDVASGLLADPAATEDPAPAGFQRFVARFTFLASADFIAFARTTTAVRLFDHNRLPGDFDAFHVDASNGFTVGEAPATCPGLPPLGTLKIGRAHV